MPQTINTNMASLNAQRNLYTSSMAQAKCWVPAQYQGSSLHDRKVMGSVRALFTAR